MILVRWCGNGAVSLPGWYEKNTYLREVLGERTCVKRRHKNRHFFTDTKPDTLVWLSSVLSINGSAAVYTLTEIAHAINSVHL